MVFVIACGALLRGDEVWMYRGVADIVVALAPARPEDFLAFVNQYDLLELKRPHLCGQPRRPLILHPEAWQEAADQLELDVAVLLTASRLMSRRYLAGEELLYPAFQRALSATLDLPAQMRNLYEEGIEPETRTSAEFQSRQNTNREGGQVTPTQVARRARELTSPLVTFARAAALVRPLINSNSV